MPTMQIGRVLAPVSSATLWGASQWSAQGNAVTLTGVLVPDTLEQALILRQQLLGYADNPDEPVIPITWGVDPTVDGFYRVKGVSVATVDGSASLRTGRFTFSMSLETVPGHAVPLIESVLVSGTMGNDMSVTGTPWHALPDAHRGYSSAGLANPTVVATGETGQNVYVYTGIAGQMTPNYWLPPRAWYQAASRLRMAPPGDTTTLITDTDPTNHLSHYRTVVGREVENMPYGWCLDNGLVRLYVGPQGYFWMQKALVGADGHTRWCGPTTTGVSATADAQQFAFGKLSPGVAFGARAGIPYEAITVIRNAPDTVSLRLTAMTPGTTASTARRYILDITLRRGSPWFSMFVTTPDAQTFNADIGGTGGLWNGGNGRFTPNGLDATGDLWIVTSARSKTNVGTSMNSTTPSTTVDWMFGLNVGGSGASSLFANYVAGMSERVVVSGR